MGTTCPKDRARELIYIMTRVTGIVRRAHTLTPHARCYYYQQSHILIARARSANSLKLRARTVLAQEQAKGAPIELWNFDVFVDLVTKYFL